MENDDKLFRLFSKFDPKPATDTPTFIRNMQRNLQTVDALKRQMARSRRAYRRAMVVAALVGFVSGITFMLSFDVLVLTLTSLIAVIVPDPASAGIQFAQTATWLVIGAATILLTLAAYNFTVDIQPDASKDL